MAKVREDSAKDMVILKQALKEQERRGPGGPGGPAGKVPGNAYQGIYKVDNTNWDYQVRVVEYGEDLRVKKVDMKPFRTG